jgi:phosphatidylglycerol---prolipoprotein diacylglyceryl transferase
MHPALFKIGSFPIPSYGVMLALSFLLGIWIATKRAKRMGLDPNVIVDVGFWIILSAIVGARAYYVILHFEEFRGNLWAIVNPYHAGIFGIGGLVMYGGFIGAILASVIFFKIKKKPILSYGDAVAPTVGFGIMFTRIGCFLNGCCFGAAAKHGGVCFPPDSAAGVHQLKIHAQALIPSQLYESAGGLAIALIILFVGSRKNVATGIQFYLVGLLYAILRFFIDFTRFYDTNERLAGLSHNQIVCIVIFIIFGALIVKTAYFKKAPPAQQPLAGGDAS